MREHIDNRSPEEIENDIERTRADFSSTIEALQHKLTPRELMDQAVDYALSTTPGAFSANLVNTVRANPIPAALIGVGVAWLMAAGRQGGGYGARARYPYTTRRSAYYADMDAGYYGEYPDRDYLGAMGETSGDGMMQRAASRTSEAASDLKDKANEVGQRISDTASDLGQRVSETASDLSQRAQRATQSARSRLQESASGAQARVSEMGQRSRTQYYRAKERAGQMVDEQPLLLGALGIAIGAALGAALPRTQRENELMGSRRDELLGTVKETAREKAETVKQSAQRVAQMAKEEAVRVKDDVSRAATQGKDQSGSSQYSSPGKSIH